MSSLFSQIQTAAAASSSSLAAPAPEVVSPSSELHIEDSPVTERQEEQPESEWVIGPKQLAALSFVGIAAIALFSSISYLAGKAAAVPAEALPPIEVKVAQPAAPTEHPSIGEQFAASSTAPVAAKAPEMPIFADPQPGKSYIQMAAVEKPVAAVFVEGLRAHGLKAFVAPGPDARIFRVLIGPLSDISAYTSTKVELDKIGLTTFMRQYDNK